MTDQELEFFKSRILEKRSELLDELGYLKDSTMSSTPQEASGEHSAYAFHMADLGTDNMEREKAFLYAHRESRLLYHLEQALDRIDKKLTVTAVSVGSQSVMPGLKLCRMQRSAFRANQTKKRRKSQIIQNRSIFANFGRKPGSCSHRPGYEALHQIDIRIRRKYTDPG